ncbi:MarR family transcriptional regulator [Stappia sp.]|uniref:helix-turn-helix transcriptional regulator n=1 Tax=Stappia sp. TaxID=1870903 RepID=UPI0032D99F5C
MSRPSDERLLYLIKSRGPVTARDAGAALAMTTAGAQHWLAKLAGEGLVVAEDRRHGRGRPRRYWALTARGHARFPDRHSDLTLDMLASTRAVFGADGLDRLIAHREAETLARYEAAMAGCATLEARVAKLAELRSAEGYMADWHATEKGGFVLVENHCPICAAAAVCQGLCRSELAIFRAVLGPDARVERTDHVLDGARRCAYAIDPAAS